MTLTPAYGRDYTSKTQVQKDWDANRDFIIADISHPYNGKYANKSDLAKEFDVVFIRYQKLTKIQNFKTR